MLSALKVRIYPTQSQKVLLTKAFGTNRWVWNHFLALTNQTYKDTGKGIAKYDMIKQLPKLKKQEDTEWLKESYSQSLQSVCLNLSQAFVNFFEKRAKYPRFKSKFGKQSLIYPQNVKLEKDKIYFPKLDWIKAKIHRPIKGKIKTVTITKNCCEQYFASILFEDGLKQLQPNKEGKVVGIDLGLNHFAITSDESKFDNPRWLNKHEQNLKVKQQRLSRREKGSAARGRPTHKSVSEALLPTWGEATSPQQAAVHSAPLAAATSDLRTTQNRNKARLAVAKIQAKIARCREDFLHKLSRRIVNENQVVCVENLNVRNAPPLASWNRIPARSAVKGMVRNRNLAKAISQVGWGRFCTMLKYKAERDGKIYFEIDRFFPSSKTCNHCLNQVDSLPLDIRHWTCAACGTHHDRDVNAARNIRDEGLRLLELGTSSTAYSPDVNRTSGRKKSTVTLSAV